MKKYAFLLMNPCFDIQQIHMDVEGIEHHLLTVRSEQEAIEKVKKLAEEGFGVIEVCGAFGEELAQRMYEETDKQVPVGYVIYPQAQEEAVTLFWQSEAGKREK